MSDRIPITTEQQGRYLTDAAFHARVEIVAQALWSTVARFDLGRQEPPYERLITATKEDLIAYAIEAVEALDAYERRSNVVPIPRREESA